MCLVLTANPIVQHCHMEREDLQMMGDTDFFFPATLTIESSGVDVRAQIMKSGEILVYGDAVPIVVDDILTRTLSNGLVENYAVLDAVYHPGHGADLPATTKLQVQKRGTKARASALSHVTYNVSGSNPRVNVQSHDHSTKIVNVTVERLFSDLKTAVVGESLAAEEKENILRSIDTMQAAQGTSSFPAAFQGFMSLAANCMTVITPFLPAITQMLTN